jgi:heat shock protein HslJ
MFLLALLRLHGLQTARRLLAIAALGLLAACNLPVVVPSPTPEPLPTPTPGPGAEIVTLYVASETIPCPDAPEQSCLQVRESPDTAYQPLPVAAVAGFAFEPGYEYELRVEKSVTSETATSAYRLITVLAKISPGAAAPPGGTTTPLEGVLWQLEALAGTDGRLRPALDQVKVTATFTNGILGGQAGCNSYSAAYHLEGDRLTISAIMSTMMACADERLNEQEQLYLNALRDVAGYTLGDGRLTLRNAAGAEILVFAAVPPAALTGTTWVLNYYHNGEEALVSSLAATQITLVFGADGRLSGSAGCNTYEATYRVEGTRLTIAALTTTRMLCAEPAGIMEQENAYLQALARAAVYTLIGDELTLFDIEGMRVAGFTAGEVVGMPPGGMTTPEAVEPGAAATPGAVAPAPAATPTPGAVAPAPAATPTPGPAPTLTDVVWQWTKLVGADGAELKVPAPDRYTLTFLRDGTLTMVADCNTGGGSYRREGSNLTIGPLATTLIACPPDSLDSRFTLALQQVTGYTLADNELILRLQDGGRMHFSPAAVAVSQSPAPTLAGTAWRWTALITAEGVTSTVNRPLRYTVSFLAAGQLRLRLDCNQGRGTYQVEGNALSITATATTRRACGAGSAWQAFLEALNQAQAYEQTDANLIIHLADGRALTLAPLR